MLASGNSRGIAQSFIPAAKDPNALIGLVGYGDSGFIQPYAHSPSHRLRERRRGTLQVAPSVSIAENSSVGTSITTPIATDPDSGDQVTFSITQGNSSGAFAINPTTGMITVANPTPLDFETALAFTLTIQAADSHGLTSTGTVTVNLTNVNEAPTLQVAPTVSIAENSTIGSAVVTQTANDPDNGDQLTYSILEGNASGAFAINATTGAITVASSTALNFEATPIFNLTIQASDSHGLTTTGTVTINLTNVNEAPVLQLVPVVSIAENSSLGTLLTTPTATDPDSGDQVTYSISHGNAFGAFAINTTTGAITVANPTFLDFETTPTYNLTIQAADSQGLTATGTVTVNLTDVDESLHLNLGGASVSWIAKHPPQAFFPQVTVTGGGKLDGAILRITLAALGSTKKMLDNIQIPSFANLGTSPDGGQKFANNQITLQIRLGPSATLETLQSFLRGITFRSTSGKGLKLTTRSAIISLASNGESSTITQTLNVRKK